MKLFTKPGCEKCDWVKDNLPEGATVTPAGMFSLTQSHFSHPGFVNSFIPSSRQAAENGPSAALSSSRLPAAGTSPPQSPDRRPPCIWTLLSSLPCWGWFNP